MTSVQIEPPHLNLTHLVGLLEDLPEVRERLQDLLVVRERLQDLFNSFPSCTMNTLAASTIGSVLGISLLAVGRWAWDRYHGHVLGLLGRLGGAFLCSNLVGKTFSP